MKAQNGRNHQNKTKQNKTKKQNVILGTEKKSAIILGKAISPNVFGKWTKKP